MAQAPKARTDERPPTDDRTTPRRDRLDEVVARIRRDAKRSPGDYLRSTEVPGGGE